VKSHHRPTISGVSKPCTCGTPTGEPDAGELALICTTRASVAHVGRRTGSIVISTNGETGSRRRPKTLAGNERKVDRMLDPLKTGDTVYKEVRTFNGIGQSPSVSQTAGKVLRVDADSNVAVVQWDNGEVWSEVADKLIRAKGR